MLGEIFNWLVKRDEEREAKMPEEMKCILKYAEAVYLFQEEVWNKLPPEDKFFTLLYLEIKGHFLAWGGSAVLFGGWDILFFKFYEDTPVKHPFDTDARYFLYDENTNTPYIGVSLNGKNFVLTIEEIEEYILRKGIPVDVYFQSEEVKKGFQYLAEIGHRTEKEAVKIADQGRTEEELQRSFEEKSEPLRKKFNLAKSVYAILPGAFPILCYQYKERKKNFSLNM